MDSLYLINTTFSSLFLEPRFHKEHSKIVFNRHIAFIQALLPKHPQMQGTYLALLTDGSYRIPLSPNGDNMAGPIVNGRVMPHENRIMSLADFIDELVQTPQIYPYLNGQTINTIVEFYPEEIYPITMNALSVKYDIKRIFL